MLFLFRASCVAHLLLCNNNANVNEKDKMSDVADNLTSTRQFLLFLFYLLQHLDGLFHR